MPKSIELRIDVTASVPLPGPLQIAASVFLPDPGKLTRPPIVIFAFPGRGYTRGYFDIEAAGHQGYSEAEHHSERGIIFVCADHLGVGASSIPNLSPDLRQAPTDDQGKCVT